MSHEPEGRPAPAQGRSGTVIAVLLLALLAAGITLRYWPSDERDVRRHLVLLADVLSVPGKETEVAHMTRVAALGEYFAPDVRVVVDGREIVTRDALVGSLTAWTPPPGGFSVQFADEIVALAGDRSTAQAGLTARLVSKNLQTGESVVEVRDLSVSMAKVQGDWVITKAEARERP
jgi:hypothetical protein